MTRILRRYGAQETEVFCIGSLLLCAAVWLDGSRTTQMRCIKHTEYDLARLEALNALSRDICTEPLNLHTARNRLTSLRTPTYQKSFTPYVGAAIAVFAFTLYFGGTLLDSGVAVVFGFLLQWLNAHMRQQSSALMRTVLSAVIIGLMIGICQYLIPSLQADRVMIGAIMLMVPGLMISGSIRDLIHGDLIAGSLKLIQSVLTAGALAIGLAWAAAWVQKLV